MIFRIWDRCSTIILVDPCCSLPIATSESAHCRQGNEATIKMNSSTITCYNYSTGELPFNKMCNILLREYFNIYSVIVLSSVFKIFITTISTNVHV